MIARTLLAAVLVGLATTACLADDWEVTKLRGRVLQLVDGAWQPLKRGDVVPDSRVLRTLTFAQAELKRGTETLALGPDTQVQIYDEHHKRPFTTVKQYFGEVAVEADVRNVEHFAVQTPYLAAVVKGTRFTVHSDTAGAQVDVERGHVAVRDEATHEAVTIGVGETASIGVEATTGKTTALAVGNSDTPAKPATLLGGIAGPKPKAVAEPSAPDKGKPEKDAGKGKSSGESPKSDKPQKGEKSGKSEKPEKPEKPDKPSKPESESGKGKSGGDTGPKADKPEKADDDRSGKGGGHDHSDD